jgi:DNA-binding transcriptional ArsR family regulator
MRTRKSPNAQLTPTSFRQLQALAHPLRFRAFERLIDAPKTGKQLAHEFHKQPTHLYHHLRVLERAGLVRQVARRKKRGTIEKYYQAVSDRVLIDERLFRRKVAAPGALIGELLRVTFDELVEAASLAALARPKPPVMVKRLRIRTSAKRIAMLQRRLEAWLSDFEKAADPAGDRHCAVTVAFYSTPAAE